MQVPDALISVCRFNPRARVGRDFVCRRYFFPALRVSIHAPAWGATQPQDSLDVGISRFNPRARVGRDYFDSIR